MFLGNKAGPADWRGWWERLFQLMCCGEEPVRLQERKIEQKQTNVTSRPAFKTSPASESTSSWFPRRAQLGFGSETVYSADQQTTQVLVRGENECSRLFSPKGWCGGVLVLFIFCEHLNWSRSKTSVHVSFLCNVWHNCRWVNFVPL